MFTKNIVKKFAFMFCGGLLIASVFYGIQGFAQRANDLNEYELAKINCLKDKGLTMYGTGWCHYCKNQKQMLGKYFKYMNFVDCDIKYKLCTERGISGYPTWLLANGKELDSGTLDELAEQAGCDVKEYKSQSDSQVQDILTGVKGDTADTQEKLDENN